VYVEKPIGNSIAECSAMVAAQKKSRRVVQVGQWQRSQKHFRDAMDFVHSGKLGKIGLVKVWSYFSWVTPISKLPDGTVTCRC
jgi:predicted dehydrogenase